MKTTRKSLEGTQPTLQLVIVALLCLAPDAFAGVNLWTSSGPDADGVRALAIDPYTPVTLYAGTYSGIFKSTDGGESWRPVNTGLPAFRAVSALAIDPSTPSTLYAGTGGVFKSSDGGESWSAANTGLTNSNVLSLAIDPSDSSRLYAGTGTAGGRVSGVFRSTNRGATWNAVNAGLPYGNTTVHALAIDPSAPSTLYAGPIFGGVYKTTNGGSRWTAINNGLPLTENPFGGTGLLPTVEALVIDPSNPSTIYAASSFSGGLFKSSDGGGSWNAVNAGLPALGSVKSLALDPSSPSTLYAASVGVFRTTDGAGSWSAFNRGLTDLHVTSLAIDPGGKSLHAGTNRSGVFDYEISSQIAPSCTPEMTSLCLLGNRFQVTLQAEDPRTGGRGIGMAIPQGDHFGYFSLPSFTGDPTLPEVFVKMADATALPPPIGGRFWVFHTGLTDLRYTMFVTDVVTGRVKSYQNDLRDPTRPCGGADTSAFGSSGVSGEQSLLEGSEARKAEAPGEWFTMSEEFPVTVEALGIAAFPAISAAAIPQSLGSCEAGVGSLCLVDNRFRVELVAVDPRTGAVGIGHAIPQGEKFGYFSLPSFTGDPTFPEVFVKMVDATSLPGGFFWLFHAALTDLQYTMTVTDTVTGAVKVYRNASTDPSKLCGEADTAVFGN